MNTFIEDRAWLTGCSINVLLIDKFTNNFLLDGFDTGSILNNKYLDFNNTEHVFRFETILSMNFELNTDGINLFNKVYLNTLKSVSLKDFKIRLLDNGFLNTTAFFDYEFANILELEEDRLKIIYAIDRLQADIKLFLDHLVSINSIVKRVFYYLGIPEFITDNSLSLHNTNLTTYHLFTENKAFITDLNKDYNLAGKSHRFKGDTFYVFPRLLIWQTRLNKEKLNFLNISFLSLAEELIYFTASINISKRVFAIINEQKILINSSFRKVFNYQNEQILSIRDAEFSLDMFDDDLKKVIDKNIGNENKFEVYKKTEESIRFAIEGVENENAQRNNKIVQGILFSITGLTLFSVLNDLFNFLSLKTLVEYDFWGLKIMLISVIFFSLIVSMLFVTKKIK